MRSRTAVLVAVSVLLAAGAYAVSRCRDSGRPDIVLFVWDTCRADRVSAHGYARPTSPRLAALAARGVTFRNCYSPSPWTPPAHASLFTGLLPRRHGLREGTSDRVHPGLPLLAETLRAEGYETVGITANPQVTMLTGLGQGFDPLFAVYEPKRGKGTGEEVLRQVESWLARRRSEGGPRRPLFLFVNLMDTHIPYTCGPESAAAMDLGALDPEARRAALDLDQYSTVRHILGTTPVPSATLQGIGPVYDASVHSTDRTTGEILDLLEGAGVLSHAFVAVTGDHGENLGEEGRLNHVMSVSEAALHVPLVVHWPGRLEGGRVESAQVRLQDLYPTILEAAGVEVPADCGRDATTLTEQPLQPRVAVAEIGHAKDAFANADDPIAATRPDMYFLSWVAVRDPSGSKYVETTFHPDDGPPRVRKECLFHVLTDPLEARCLLDGNPSAAVRDEAERLRDLGR